MHRRAQAQEETAVPGRPWCRSPDLAERVDLHRLRARRPARRRSTIVARAASRLTIRRSGLPAERVGAEPKRSGEPETVRLSIGGVEESFFCNVVAPRLSTMGRRAGYGVMLCPTSSASVALQDERIALMRGSAGSTA